MPTVSIRVDEDLKRRMDRHREINWSAELRQHIDSVLTEKNERDLARAVLISERLSHAVDPEEVQDHDSTEMIREWRESRYGPGWQERQNE